MDHCPCGSGKEYEACCGEIIGGKRAAPTAEALMRSRYSAFVKDEIDYLRESLHPDHRRAYAPVATRQWAEQSEWEKLEVVGSIGGGEGDGEGAGGGRAAGRRGGAARARHERRGGARREGRRGDADGERSTPGTGRN